MAKKFKYNRVYRNDRVLIFEDGVIIDSQVVDVQHGEHIETEDGIFHISDCKKYYDKYSGGITYLVNADLPVLAEANKLKQLRRSVAIANISKYETGKPFDFMKLMPWIVTIAALIFA